MWSQMFKRSVYYNPKSGVSSFEKFETHGMFIKYIYFLLKVTKIGNWRIEQVKVLSFTVCHFVYIKILSLKLFAIYFVVIKE